MSKALYIYEDVEKLTTGYHDTGGLVIVTGGDPSEAWQNDLRRIAAEHPSNKTHIEGGVIWDLPEPTRVIQVADTEADSITVFPDQGCC